MSARLAEYRRLLARRKQLHWAADADEAVNVQRRLEQIEAELDETEREMLRVEQGRKSRTRRGE